MKEIADFLDHQEYPNISGIIFPDGFIQLVTVSVNWETPPSFQVQLDGTTTVETLKSQGQLSWSDGAILGKTVSEDEGFEAVCGEGDFGSDGFVAVVHTETQKLVWLAAFNCSNPFKYVSFKEGCVYAESTIGTVWCFPLSDPCQFVIGKAYRVPHITR
jgi:hypothetical protein